MPHAPCPTCLQARAKIEARVKPARKRRPSGLYKAACDFGAPDDSHFVLDPSIAFSIANYCASHHPRLVMLWFEFGPHLNESVRNRMCPRVTEFVRA
jgi:hypothetical protein